MPSSEPKSRILIPNNTEAIHLIPVNKKTDYM